MWETGICSLCHFGGGNMLFEVLSIVLFCCLRGKHYYIAINISDCFSWEKTESLYAFLTHISTTLSDHVTSMVGLWFTLAPSAYLYFFSTGYLVAFGWQTSPFSFPTLLLFSFPVISSLFPLSPSLLPFLHTLIHSLFLLQCFSLPFFKL